jgi:hypothetical protein
MKTPTPIIPADGAAITLQGGKLQVPPNPLIPFIEGDGRRVILRKNQPRSDYYQTLPHRGYGKIYVN